MKTKIVIFIALLALVACNETKENTVQKRNTQAEFPFKKEGVLQIKNNENKEIAHFNIEFADDDYKRETGLMYRKSMKPGNAMLFIFDAEKPLYFYMKNTYIPLDIIYINTQNKVVHIAKEAKPLDETTLPSEKPAKYVLEINAGLSDRYGIKQGDVVFWQKL